MVISMKACHTWPHYSYICFPFSILFSSLILSIFLARVILISLIQCKVCHAESCAFDVVLATAPHDPIYDCRKSFVYENLYVGESISV